MHTTYKLLLCLALCLAFQSSLDAQFWKKVQKRVEKRAENRALNEVDKATDKAIDKALEAPEEETNQKGSSASEGSDSEPSSSPPDATGGSDWMNQMLNGSNVELPDEYAIDVRLDYDVTDDKGKVSKLSYLLGDDGHWGFITHDKKNTSMMVIDENRDVIVMYTEKKGKKTAQKLPSMMNSQFIAEAVDESDEISGDFSVNKTGRTKTIAGYMCSEFHIESTEGSGDVWTTSDLDADFMSMFSRSMSKSKKLKKMSEAMKQLQGTTLESHYTDKKGKESHMVATAVDTSPPVIDNSDYEITGLGQ